MAIITCLECGKEMSDAALSCPICGKLNSNITQKKTLRRFLDWRWNCLISNNIFMVYPS